MVKIKYYINGYSYTAKVLGSISTLLKPRDNIGLSGGANGFSCDLSFSRAIDTHKDLDYAAEATATSILRTFGARAVLSDDTSEYSGILRVSSCERSDLGYDYKGVFLSGGFDWVAALPSLCELELGATVHSKANVEATMIDDLPYQLNTYDNGALYHSISYYTQKTPFYGIMQARPSVYIRAVVGAIFETAKGLGYSIDAPFFDTEFFRKLLIHTAVDWNKVPINATEKNVSAFSAKLEQIYNLASNTSKSGEFLPYSSLNSVANTTITESGLGCFFPSQTHPVVTVPHIGNYNNVIGDYIRFVAPKDGTYSITVRYSGHKQPNINTGILSVKNGNDFSRYLLAPYTTTGYFDVEKKYIEYLQAGDYFYFARHEMPAITFIDVRTLVVDINYIKTVEEDTEYNIAKLLPCSPCTDLLKGLSDMFNLVFYTGQNTIKIAPMFDTELLTGEFVQGFYTNTENNKQLSDNIVSGNYADSYSNDTDNYTEYLYSFKGDNTDKNATEKSPQLYSKTVQFDTAFNVNKATKQKRFDNAFFAPTISENGVIILIDYPLNDWQNNTGAKPEVFNYAPRILYKHGKVARNFDWYTSGNNLGFVPLAFQVDTALNTAYLPYNQLLNESGLVARFWQRWIDFASKTFTRTFTLKKAQRLENINPSLIVNIYGVSWILDEVDVLLSGDINDIESKSVKLNILT